MYTPERELELMVVNQINNVKLKYSIWTHPDQLARELEISVAVGKLGPSQEGAAFADDIIIDSTIGVKARQRFTFYHEIVHHLIKRNDELYSILHDQYRSDDDLTRIIEHLCNVGAAEFIIPRATILAAIEAGDFSISLVRDFSRVGEVSPTAVCVQLALCAKQKCVTTVCRMVQPPRIASPQLFDEVKPEMVLQVSMAVSSSCMKYAIARGSLLPKGHLFYEAYKMSTDDIVYGIAPIPFRNNHQWKVQCEALRIGKQVFGIFHVDSPPVESRNQLRLF